jgi:hypothetical protein
MQNKLSAGQGRAPNLAVKWHPSQPPEDVPWAHCSGWMQLSGRRQTVSCVVPCREQRALLSTLLPQLADTLTECGYPWEVLLLDSASQDGTFELLQPWCRVPGFRLASFNGPVSRAVAALVGLVAARGDAVLILEPGEAEILSFIAPAIERWENGEGFVVTGRDPNQRSFGFKSAPESVQLWPDVLLDGRGFGRETSGFVLLSRSLARSLLRAA